MSFWEDKTPSPGQPVEGDAQTQGSLAWHDTRRRGIGGSEIASILGLSPYRSAYQLWLDKTGQKTPADISALPHVQRGILGEKVCRMILEREMGISFTPKSWELKGTVCRASDDGYSLDEDLLLEIKCMGRDNHALAAQGVIPEHYRVQVQYNLAVSRAAKALFVSYRPEDETMHKIEVLPDEDEGNALLQAAQEFWSKFVAKREPPPLQPLDFKKLRGLDEIAAQYIQLTKRLEEIERLRDPLNAILDRALGEHLGGFVPGLKLERAWRRGEIDYSRVPELNGVDLEPYRQPGHSYLQITPLNVTVPKPESL